MFRVILAVAVSLALCGPAAAQQRPLVTEDPEVIGAGRLLIEGGLDLSRSQTYTVSGLEGNLLRAPVVGLSVGISSIAEFQIDGGFFNRLTITDRRTAALSNLVDVTGSQTHDVEDIVIGTKIRLVAEAAKRPAIGFRFATRLPNASNESGLGLDTTDFYASILGAKTIQSIRVAANIGVAFLSDPTEGHRQNDALTYGLSVARAVTDRVEFVGELNGRFSRDVPYPGTESRSRLNLGGRYTRGPVRFDGSVFVGLTSIDPSIGFSTGFTYVFNAFQVP
jgi:hypothetical protein